MCYTHIFLYSKNILGKDSRFPLPLRRCLLGFREGMELFKFGLSHLTGVLRQKGYVYDLGGHSTGTILEVCISFCFGFLVLDFLFSQCWPVMDGLWFTCSWLSILIITPWMCCCDQ